ncbi:aminotransferase class I/II-fold pyridoxal phosphate-dependent enzyme [soil metagenome]
MADPLSQLTLEQLRRRTSAKWRQYPDDVLPMWVAEMDVPLAEPIVTAVEGALAIGDTGYPSGGAYCEALRDFAASRWNWRFEARRACLVPDLMSGVADVIGVVTEPGATVVINPPVYPPFFWAARNTGRELLECPLDPSGRLDLARLERAFAEASRNPAGAAYLLCSPHNPTGTVHTAEELNRVAELASEYRVRVISDEIHAPLSYAGATFIPYLSVEPEGDGFAIYSASKAWNLAGLKAAVAIAGSGADDDLERLRSVTHSASHIGVIAHTAALTSATDWLDDLLLGLERNRDELARLLAERLPTLGFRPPDATFLAWLDFGSLDLGTDPAAALLERGRVALNHGPSFGRGSEGHARLNFACPPALLAEGVERIVGAVEAVS